MVIIIITKKQSSSLFSLSAFTYVYRRPHVIVFLILLQLVVAGSIQFTYKVSAEQGYDYFEFVLDDVLYFYYSNRPWTTFTLDIEPGFHIAEWIYYKDQDVSAGEDRASIAVFFEKR